MLFPMCVKVIACTSCVALKLGCIYIYYELYLELDVSMKLWCLLEPSRAQGDSVGLSRWERLTLRCVVIALPSIRVFNRRVVKSSIIKRRYLYESVH